MWSIWVFLLCERFTEGKSEKVWGRQQGLGAWGWFFIVTGGKVYSLLED